MECRCLDQPISESLAIGGILRDQHGKFICMFPSPIPFMEINNAEILAIHRAIKITSSCSRVPKVHLIVESDSKNVVQWCKNKDRRPWNLNFIINFIRGEAKKDPGISITYKGRGSNMVADSLAKQGLSRRDEFLAWIQFSSLIFYKSCSLRHIWAAYERFLPYYCKLCKKNSLI